MTVFRTSLIHLAIIYLTIPGKYSTFLNSYFSDEAKSISIELSHWLNCKKDTLCFEYLFACSHDILRIYVSQQWNNNNKAKRIFHERITADCVAASFNRSRLVSTDLRIRMIQRPPSLTVSWQLSRDEWQTARRASRSSFSRDEISNMTNQTDFLFHHVRRDFATLSQLRWLRRKSSDETLCRMDVFLRVHPHRRWR